MSKDGQNAQETRHYNIQPSFFKRLADLLTLSQRHSLIHSLIKSNTWYIADDRVYHEAPRDQAIIVLPLFLISQRSRT